MSTAFLTDISKAFLTDIRATLLPARDSGHLTTTVLTLTIVGIAADSALAGGGGSQAGRRLLSVATMLAGAVVGTVLIRHAQAWCPLLIALVVIIAGAAATYTLGKMDPAWVRPKGGQSR